MQRKVKKKIGSILNSKILCIVKMRKKIFSGEEADSTTSLSLQLRKNEVQ